MQKQSGLYFCATNWLSYVPKRAYQPDKPCQKGFIVTHLIMYPVKNTLDAKPSAHLELGWAAFLCLESLFQSSSPSQEVILTPGSISSSRPSQKTPPSLVWATLVKMVLCWIICMAKKFVLLDVPVNRRTSLVTSVLGSWRRLLQGNILIFQTPSSKFTKSCRKS